MKDPKVARMAGYKFYVPDEMDDVSDWAKEAARKMLQPPESIRAKINKIFKSTPRTEMTYICVNLISGKEDVFAFQKLANAVENAHTLNKLDPSGRWTVKPKALLRNL